MAASIALTGRTGNMRSIHIIIIIIGIQLVLSSTAISQEKAPEDQLLTTAETKRISKLMERAKASLIEKNYNSAIIAYTKVLKHKNSVHYQSALEYLGLAREKNRQFSHAKSIYTQYLSLYPSGKDATRVKQRADALISASFAPKKKLRKLERNKKKNQWINYGSLFQAYRRDVYLSTDTGKDIRFSNAYTSFLYSSKLKTRRINIRNRISLSNNYNLIYHDDDNENIRISRLSSEMDFAKTKTSIRVGRQTDSSSSALGRFDGAVASWKLKPYLSVKVISGFPVNYDTYHTIETDQSFNSVSMGYESMADNFDANLYLVTEKHQGFVNRKVVGLNIGNYTKQFNYYGSIDYDYSYALLNRIMFNAGYHLDKINTLRTRFSFRRSPYIATTNALQGEIFESLEELQENSEIALSQLAIDRTSRYYSANLSWQNNLKKDLELNHDYTLTHLSGTKSVRGVSGLQGTGYEHYFMSQVIVSNVIYSNDINVIALRYDKRNTMDRFSFRFDRRDRVSRKYRIRERLTVDHQKRVDNTTVKIVRVSFKLAYHHSKTMKIDLEVGGQKREWENTFSPSNETSSFFSIGYQSQF